jgi:hypothetical protein
MLRPRPATPVELATGLGSSSSWSRSPSPTAGLAQLLGYDFDHGSGADLLPSSTLIGTMCPLCQRMVVT